MGLGVVLQAQVMRLLVIMSLGGSLFGMSVGLAMRRSIDCALAAVLPPHRPRCLERAQ